MAISSLFYHPRVAFYAIVFDAGRGRFAVRRRQGPQKRRRCRCRPTPGRETQAQRLGVLKGEVTAGKKTDAPP